MTLEQAYLTLGIKPGATPEQIKAAYRKKALELHPDRRSEAEKPYFEGKFRELKDAYELIKTSAPLPAAFESGPVETGPVETEGWGPEIKVPQGRWRGDLASKEPESAPLSDKLGLKPSWDLESWALWWVVIPIGAIVLVLMVRLIASWVNP